MQIEKDMYVRLKNDLEQTIVIQQIGAVYEQTIVTTNVNMFSGEYIKENIIKSSYNLIDLIEVGDYVNGMKVEEITDEKELFCDSEYYCNAFDEDEIDSIVTHEQFKQMEYEVEE